MTRRASIFAVQIWSRLDQRLAGQFLPQPALQLGDPAACPLVQLGVLGDRARDGCRAGSRSAARSAGRGTAPAAASAGPRAAGSPARSWRTAGWPTRWPGRRGRAGRRCPRNRPTDAVQLRGVTPAALLAHGGREAEERRAHHQCRLGLPGVGRGLQPVVAQRQVAGQLEGRLPGEDAVDPARRLVVDDLRYVPAATLLQADGEVHPLARREGAPAPDAARPAPSPRTVAAVGVQGRCVLRRPAPPARCSVSDASTSIPARIAITVSSVTSVSRPFQSQNSVAMPKAEASSAQERVGQRHARAPSSVGSQVG